jgi:hypothetical protein
VSEAGPTLYLVYGVPAGPVPFVCDHVQPKLESVPACVEIRRVGPSQGAYEIEAFLRGEPGVMADIDRLRFEIHRVDPSPTDLTGAVEHNAWWDAMALRQRLGREASR